MEAAAFVVPASAPQPALPPCANAAVGASAQAPLRAWLPTAGARLSCTRGLAAVAGAALTVALAAPRSRGRRALPQARPRCSRVNVSATGVAERPAEAATESGSAEVPKAKLDFAKSLFADVLGVKVPPKLDVFLAVLQASGYNILGKDEWRTIGGDLHPFLLPLATKGALDDDLEVVGLLIRTPNGVALQPHAYQVVSQKPRKFKRLNLLAPDISKHIAKRAEEANFFNEKKDMPVIDATKDAYEVKFKGNDKTALDKWLLLEVGAFPETYRNLALEHIEGGDPQTGLVIADTMRDAFGTAWGFPHAFVTKVMRDNMQSLSFENAKKTIQTRDMEADHSAVRCFTTGYPLWTLDENDYSLEELLLEAKMEKLGSVDALRVFYIRRSTDDQRAAVRTGSISLGCAAMARAQALMDAACCGHKSYEGLRQDLRDIYDEVPGAEPLVDMIDYFSKS